MNDIVILKNEEIKKENLFFYKHKLLFLIVSILIAFLPFMGFVIEMFGVNISVEKVTIISTIISIIYLLIIIYYDNKTDKTWEETPAIPFSCYMLSSIGLFFSLMFLDIDLETDPLLTIIGVLLMLGFSIVYTLYRNQKANISKNYGFIVRDKKLYLIALKYETNNSGVIYAPSGTVIQGATLPYNVNVAKNVQNMEQQIRQARKDETYYIDILNRNLKYLEENPNYNLVKTFGGLYTIPTTSSVSSFLYLKDPKIVSDNNKKIVISYVDIDGIRKNKEFANKYDNLSQIIKELN